MISPGLIPDLHLHPATGRTWPRRRQQVYERDGRVCAHCGATEHLQIDHKFCRTCNIAKADFTMDEWLASMESP